AGIRLRVANHFVDHFNRWLIKWRRILYIGKKVDERMLHNGAVIKLRMKRYTIKGRKPAKARAKDGNTLGVGGFICDEPFYAIRNILLYLAANFLKTSTVKS